MRKINIIRNRCMHTFWRYIYTADGGHMTTLQAWYVILGWLHSVLITPLHRDYDLCDFLVWPQNCSGHHWKVERRLNGCLGRSRVVHRMLRHRPGHHGRCQVLSKKCVLLWTLCINLSDASACLVPPLCHLWLTNTVHWGITVATTVPPFCDHGNPWATLAIVLPQLCLCATCCATTAALVIQGRHKGCAAAVTQKQNFLGLGDHWAA